MADPSVRAYSTKANSTDNPWTISNPTGLTAGDLMVLAIGSVGGTVPSAPSGWTQQAQGGTSGSTRTATIFTKVATASDVSAGSVSLTNTSGSTLGGLLWAVQDAGDVEAATGGYSSVNTNVLSISGFDPGVSGDLILCAATFTYTFSSFATANNNPSWTNVGLSSYYEFGSASYGSSDATGSVTVTISGGSSKLALAYVAIAPVGASAATGFMATMRGLW